MSEATFSFPRGFLWGTATSSHQVEGNNRNNDWWRWEEQGRIDQGHRSGLACDWWSGRWREDFDRAAQGAQNAHRLSIEWSRVQPAPDQWDEDALDHYREMMQGLYDRGLTPLVTLHHFSLPIWLADQGGWESEDSPRLFAAYVEKVAEALKEYVSLWCTINEPDVLTVFSYAMGLWPPGKVDLPAALRVAVNLLKAHAAAFQAIRRVQPTSRVGIAINRWGLLPARAWNPLDRLVSGLQARLFNDLFPQALATGRFSFPLSTVRVPEAKGTHDYLGLNYYSEELVAFKPFAAGDFFSRRRPPPGASLSPTGHMSNRPEGFFRALRWSLDFGVPVIVTENGVEDADDQLRPRYLAEHLRQLWRGVNFNWPIKGYFHWSLVDNFEWERGWTQRWGLWSLDTETQARRKRPSADFYAAVCRANSLSSSMVAEYAPEVFDTLFP